MTTSPSARGGGPRYPVTARDTRGGGLTLLARWPPIAGSRRRAGSRRQAGPTPEVAAAGSAPSRWCHAPDGASSPQASPFRSGFHSGGHRALPRGGGVVVVLVRSGLKTTCDWGPPDQRLTPHLQIPAKGPSMPIAALDQNFVFKSPWPQPAPQPQPAEPTLPAPPDRNHSPRQAAAWGAGGIQGSSLKRRTRASRAGMSFLRVVER